MLINFQTGDARQSQLPRAGFSAPPKWLGGLGGQAHAILRTPVDVSTLKTRLLKKKAKFFRIAFWKFRAKFCLLAWVSVENSSAVCSYIHTAIYARIAGKLQ